MTARGTIVVGVDGSDCSRAALEFALDEAVRRDAAVDVVLAMPEVDFWVIGYAMSPALVEELSADLEKMGRDMVDTVLREGGGYRRDVPVRVRALGGAPGRVLVEQSHDADLLVVGHRGRGGLRSAVLGSVGLQCVLHASVPVTVVRPRQPAASVDGDREAGAVIAEPRTTAARNMRAAASRP
jgi:nucleotide-binding universal stress UspA family protein